jgi:hypothetical protein
MHARRGYWAARLSDFEANRGPWPLDAVAGLPRRLIRVIRSRLRADPEHGARLSRNEIAATMIAELVY